MRHPTIPIPVILLPILPEEMRQRQEEVKTAWTKKGGTSHFGYKHHAIVDRDYDLIRRISTTTFSVHDSQVDLSEKGDVVYRDRGYQGARCKGFNATMKRGARNHPICINDMLRNERITRKRSKGERPVAAIKTVFYAGAVKVTELARSIAIILEIFGHEVPLEVKWQTLVITRNCI